MKYDDEVDCLNWTSGYDFRVNMADLWIRSGRKFVIKVTPLLLLMSTRR